MTSSERDRKDLESVVGALLSRPGPRTATTTPEAAPAPLCDPTDIPDSPGARAQSGPARLEVVTAVACGEPAAAPLFLLAVAALPTPAPRTAALSPAGDEAEWLGALRDESGRFGEMEQSGGRVVVLLPPRDGPEVRALAFAAGSHLLWLGPGEKTLGQARAFLEALHFSCDWGRVGWLAAPEIASGLAEDIFREWAGPVGARSAAALGIWTPGRPLPSSVCGFLGAPARTALRPLSWAFEVLRRASPRCGAPGSAAT